MVETTRGILPGAVRQNGYVVSDLYDAMQHWLDAGHEGGTDPVRPLF